MNDELLVSVLAPNIPQSRCITVACHDCGTPNHVTVWQVYPLPGAGDATAVTCWNCDARQHAIVCSAVPAGELAELAYTYTPPAPRPVVAFGVSGFALHAS